MTTPTSAIPTPEKFGFTTELPEEFDHQITGTYGDCQRMLFYTHVLGRRRTTDQSYALLWGTVFHRIAESWKRDNDLDNVFAIIENNIPETVEDRYGRDQRRMQEVFLEWVKFNRFNPLETLKIGGEAAVEAAVCVGCYDACPLSEHGCGITYAGRIDEPVRWNRLIGPLDYKTTVMNEKDPIGEYKLSHQITGYVWQISHLVGERSWGGIIERILCNKSNLDVHRYPIPMQTDQLREWAQTEKIVQAEIRQKLRDHPFDEVHWQQNRARCWDPWPCPWRDVCMSPRDQNFRYNWMKTHTKERRWDYRNPEKGDKAA